MPRYGKPVKINPNGSGYDAQGQYMTPDEVREGGGSSKGSSGKGKLSHQEQLEAKIASGKASDFLKGYYDKLYGSKTKPVAESKPVANPPKPVAKPPVTAPSASSTASAAAATPAATPLAGLTTIAPGTPQQPAEIQTPTAPMSGGLTLEPEPPMSTDVASQSLGALRALGRRTLPDSGAPLAALRRVY